MQTNPASKSLLQLQPFNVTTTWLTVTTNILSRHAERMQRIKSYQINSVRFCSGIVRGYLGYSPFNRRLDFECLVSASLQGKRTSRITFQITADDWTEIEALCKRINTTPTAFIRAAFANQAQKWAEFDQESKTLIA